MLLASLATCVSASSLVGLGLGDLAHGGQEVKRASSHHFFLIYVTTLPSCPLEIILWPTHGTQVLGQSPIKLINTGQYFVRFVRSTALCLATSYHILMIQTFFLYTAYMIFRISGCQEDSLLSCRFQPSFPFPFKMNHIVWSYRKTPSLLRQERKYARSAIPKNANEGGSKYAAISFPKTMPSKMPTHEGISDTRTLHLGCPASIDSTYPHRRR